MRPEMTTLADIQSDFDWDEYLRLLGPEAGDPAPAACFKQAAEPPSNHFQLGHRLESRDPRNPDNTCIASVIDRLGPRLRLRLDGSDDRNDFFRLVDSEDLFPHPSGRFIVPPLGFAKSSNYWPGFLEKVKAAGNFAPADCFVRPPASPAKNFFAGGQKLEAIDRKNPLFVCPATVKEVRQDRIFVSFDGWRGAFDYWCRYDCRDIFPVGWCQRAGYPVQPPGNRAPQQPQPQQRYRGKHASGGSSPSPNSGTFSDKSAAASPQLPASSAAAPAASPTPVAIRIRAEAASAVHFSSDSLRRRLTKLLGGIRDDDAYHDEATGDVDPASKQVYSALPNDAFRDLLQVCLDASRSPSRMMTRMPRVGVGADAATPGHSVVAAQEGGSGGSSSAASSRRRLRRVLPRVDSAEEFWRLLTDFLSQIGSRGLFEPAAGGDEAADAASTSESEPAVADAVVQASKSSADSATAVDSVTDRAKLEAETAATPSATPPKEISRPASPTSATSSTSLQLSEARPLPGRGSLDSCSAVPKSSTAATAAVVTSTPAAAAAVSAVACSAASASTRLDSGGATAPKLARLSDPGVGSAPSSDMSEWSVSDVSEFLRDSGLGSLVPLFADQAIDGAALLLLSTQAMMKFMGVKLGPALKLLSCVEKAKRRLSLLHCMRSSGTYRHS
ncbi:hypothetical protein BOX15_Mlig020925g1 [Macrostomum lignano]|uniref:SAM domain-containing protein n=1 Tax=Macrostomum lignano TaxID=282301 RepID=A0A267GJJ4_9PLAT|nr:hypothetical protein BOX15_Mlig008802g1 [Macrostomum lignano]PAA85534.1 hypothetical protein BOX15_Mlig020925g1 [Macrostomum lignano]